MSGNNNNNFKRKRDNFNPNNFNSSGRMKNEKQNQGMDRNKTQKLEENLKEMKFNKTMNPFHIKMMIEKIKEAAKAKSVLSVSHELAVNEVCKFSEKEPDEVYIGIAPELPLRSEYATNAGYKDAYAVYTRDIGLYTNTAVIRRKEWKDENKSYTESLEKLKGLVESDMVELVLMRSININKENIIRRNRCTSALEYVKELVKQIKEEIRWNPDVEVEKMYEAIAGYQIREEGDVRVWLRNLKEMIKEYMERGAKNMVSKITGLSRSQKEKREGEYFIIMKDDMNRNKDLIQSIYAEFKSYGTSSAVESSLRAYENQNGSKAGKSPFIYKEGSPNRGLFNMFDYMDKLVERMVEDEERSDRLWFSPIYNKRSVGQPGSNDRKDSNHSKEVKLDVSVSSAGVSNPIPNGGASRGAEAGANRGAEAGVNRGAGSSANRGADSDATSNSQKECAYCIGIGKYGKAVLHAADNCYSNPQSTAFKGSPYGPGRGHGRDQSRGGRSGERGRGRHR